jgi:hypothetical protein
MITPDKLQKGDKIRFTIYGQSIYAIVRGIDTLGKRVNTSFGPVPFDNLVHATLIKRKTVKQKQ